MHVAVKELHILPTTCDTLYIAQQYEVYKEKAKYDIASTVVACNGRVSEDEHDNYYDAYD